MRSNLQDLHGAVIAIVAQVAREVNMNSQSSQTRTERVALNLTPREIERIDDWGFARRIRARSEVIRRLMIEGLDQETKGESEATA